MRNRVRTMKETAEMMGGMMSDYRVTVVDLNTGETWEDVVDAEDFGEAIDNAALIPVEEHYRD